MSYLKAETPTELSDGLSAGINIPGIGGGNVDPSTVLALAGTLCPGADFSKISTESVTTLALKYAPQLLAQTMTEQQMIASMATDVCNMLKTSSTPAASSGTTAAAETTKKNMLYIGGAIIAVILGLVVYYEVRS